MRITQLVFLPAFIYAFPEASRKVHRDDFISVAQRNAQDSLFDGSAGEPFNPSNQVASITTPSDSTSNVDMFSDIPPDVDGLKTLSTTPDLDAKSVTSPLEGSSPGFATAFVPDQDPESAKPPCTLPSSAACCIKRSMFTSCVWWGLDRLFCEDSENYACCQSIEDYIGHNCEQVGEEGKDWDWLEDLLRTPIIIPDINLPPLPLIPDLIRRDGTELG